jgi:hypothetical protein
VLVKKRGVRIYLNMIKTFSMSDEIIVENIKFFNQGREQKIPNLRILEAMAKSLVFTQ